MSLVPDFLAPPGLGQSEARPLSRDHRHALPIDQDASGDVRHGNPNTDFGRGFYTTTSRRQARAWQLALDENGTKSAIGSTFAVPVVIRFRVSRDSLAKLETLSFARGDYHFDPYWSFVHHCRSGNEGHGRSGGSIGDPRYDLAAGPVAAVWRTRLAISNSGQYSFHTDRGSKVLDNSIKRVEKVQ